MKRSLDVLNSIRIASPCTQAWDAMAGDNFARHCGSCDKTVFDISALDAERAVELIVAHEGHLCVRLYRRADGKVLTADCPIGRIARLRQKVRRGFLVAASWLGLVSGIGCDKREGFVVGEMCPPPPPTEIGPMPREVADAE